MRAAHRKIRNLSYGLLDTDRFVLSRQYYRNSRHVMCNSRGKPTHTQLILLVFVEEQGGNKNIGRIGMYNMFHDFSIHKSKNGFKRSQFLVEFKMHEVTKNDYFRLFYACVWYIWPYSTNEFTHILSQSSVFPRIIFHVLWPRISAYSANLNVLAFLIYLKGNCFNLLTYWLPMVSESILMF